MNKISQYLNFKSITLGLVLGALLFLASFGLFAKYRSTVTILMITKSPYAASQQKEILSNIANLPKTLTFYNNIIKETGEVIKIEDKSEFEKKKDWDNILKVKTLKDSSVIEISVLADNRDDAQLLVQKTTRALFDTTSIYYNIKNDLDLRQIDGPITDWVFVSWYWWLLGSLLVGLLIAVVIFLLFPSAKDKVTEKTKTISFKNTLFKKPEFFASSKTDEAVKNEMKEEIPEGGPQTPAEDIPTPMTNVTSAEDSEKKELEALEKIIQQDIYPNYPEMPKRAEVKASAPDNLPIADESFLQHVKESEAAQEKEEEKEEAEDIAEKTPPSQEPTPEELKKRLNQLLKGK